MMRLVIAVVVFLAIPVLGMAAVLNVPSGSYPTIQSAIIAANPGDTVLVAPGNYNEDIDFLGKDITVQSSGGAAVTTIQGTGTNSVVIIDGTIDDLVVLDGFTITGGTGYDISLFGLTGFGGGGIFCNFQTTNQNNPVVRITNNIIKNNEISLGLGGGIIFLHESGFASCVNNVITGNMVSSWGGGVYVAFAGGVEMINCTITENTVTNLFFGGGGGLASWISWDVSCSNCIFWNNEAPEDPEIFPGFYGVSVNYSDVEGGWPGTGNIDDDPLFAVDGFHLQDTSPCIDVGNNSDVPTWITTDIDGEDRIQDGTVDMGADETGTSTMVELISFTATGEFNRVAVEWETASEIDNAGFHIWRSATSNKEEGEWIRVTEQLIPSQGGPTWGAKYLFVDRGVVPSQTYSYRLEDVSYSGVSTLYKPVLTRWKD